MNVLLTIAFNFSTVIFFICSSLSHRSMIFSTPVGDFTLSWIIVQVGALSEDCAECASYVICNRITWWANCYPRDSAVTLGEKPPLAPIKCEGTRLYLHDR